MFTHEIKIQRSRVPFIIGGVLALLVLAMLLVPFPHAVKAGFALQPASLTEVKATRAGIVEKVVVADSDAVDAGTVLVKLDVAELNTKVQQATDEVSIAEKKRQTAVAKNRNAAKAQSVLEKAQAAEKTAKAELDKEPAGPKAAAAKKKLEAATAAVDKAQKAYDAAAPKTPELDAEVKKANDELAAAKAELAKSDITAPEAGVVVGLSLKAGAKVAVGDVVGKLGAPTPLRVMLAPRKPAVLKAGQAVELYFADGVVKTTLTVAGQDTAEARLDNKDGKIKLSTEGEAVITAEPQPLIHLGK